MRALGVLGLLVAAAIALRAVDASASGTAGLSFTSAHASRWCSGTLHGYAVHVKITNKGTATSPQHFDVPMVFVRDGSSPSNWSASSGLPAIRPNHSANLTIVLTPRAGMAGTAPALPLIATLNKSQVSVAKWPSGAVVCRTLKVLKRGSGIGAVLGYASPRTAIPQQVSAASIVMAPRVHIIPPVVIPQPKDLTYTTNPTTCAQHAGLLVAILCPDIINRGGTILLVWRWDAKIPIDGFYVYRTSTQVHFGKPGHRGKSVVTKRTLVDTQTDASLTIRAIKPFKKGECFIVVAYRGKIQSDPSNRFCVGATAFVNTPMGLQHLDDCHSVTKRSPTLYRQCQGYALQGLYVLTWSWSPCAAPGCVSNIDGYNVYLSNKEGSYVAVPFFTQTYGRFAPGEGWSRGQCYVVTAFVGRTESQASNPNCVTLAPPRHIVLPPAPRPPARGGGGLPSHVDYHITNDTFPQNIDVQSGGSVTWFNDDTDNHTVTTYDNATGWTDVPYIFVDEVLYPGESYTITFPYFKFAGSGYSQYYFCDYHGEGDATFGHGPNEGFMEGYVTVH